MKTDFLRKRMTELREKNGKTLSQLAKLSGYDKSTLSRAEKIGGKAKFDTVRTIAEKYCDTLGIEGKQRELFLRGARAAVVEVCALMKRPELLDELSEEYSCVFVPSMVVEDLLIKKRDLNRGIASRAVQILDRIDANCNKNIVVQNPDIETTSDYVIADVADYLSKKMVCEVDIVIYDADMALGIKGNIADNKMIHVLYLDEYTATKQGLINMSVMNKINAYYADSYDDLSSVLEVEVPDQATINAYFPDGYTMIISAVNRQDIPISQRKKKIEWLVRNGADINKRDCDKYNLPPLSHAIINDDFDMFHFLLHDCNANPNTGTKNPYDIGKVRHKNDGNMPLMIAAYKNRIDMVKELCADKRTSLNQQDTNGYTALIKAGFKGNMECYDIISKAGADPTIIDIDGMTADEYCDEFLRSGDFNR